MNFEELLRDPARQAEMQRREEQRKAEDAKNLRAARAKAIADSGIPVVFAEILANGIDPTQAKTEADATGTGIVVLSGAPGCGKTVAACSWVREPLMRDDAFGGAGVPSLRIASPLFVTSARLSRWDRYDVREMDRLLRAPRLVIDDVGAEFSDAKGNFNAIIDELIADRAANRRPMILTTNLDGAAFKARYGERIADRIREVGNFVSLDGGSLRKRKDAA